MAKSARTTGESRVRRRASPRKAEGRTQAAEGTPAMEMAGAATRGNGEAHTGQQAPTREEIAQRAYEIYRARGSSHGFDLDDWLRAERELLG
jgi:hypothetical protein